MRALESFAFILGTGEVTHAYLHYRDASSLSRRAVDHCRDKHRQHLVFCIGVAASVKSLSWIANAATSGGAIQSKRCFRNLRPSIF
jgi:hypothetical protein